MSVITITNEKGGVGKTTTCLSLASICASLKNRTLIIDTDPQCNASQSTASMEHSNKGYNILTLFQLIKEQSLTIEEYLAFINETQVENLYCLPANIELSPYSEEMIKDETQDCNILLKTIVNVYRDYFDFIFIDTTPFFGVLTRNAIIASDYIVAPLKGDGYSYEGFSTLIERIMKVIKNYNLKTQFKGFFLNNVNPRTNLFKQLYKQYDEELGKNFLYTYIRQDNSINISTTTYTPLLLYAENAKANLDYKKLLIELDILPEKVSHKLIKQIQAEEKKEKERKKKKGK